MLSCGDDVPAEALAYAESVALASPASSWGQATSALDENSGAVLLLMLTSTCAIA